MGGCFGCFRARANRNQQHFPPQATTTLSFDDQLFDLLNLCLIENQKARVSQKPLSDLFVAREIEDFGSIGKTASHKNVAVRCDDAIAHTDVDSSKQFVQLYTPAKLSDVQKGLESSEGTPNSCICDPPNAVRTLVSTSDKSDTKHPSSTILYPFHTIKDNLIDSIQKPKNKPISFEEVGNIVTFEDEPGLTGRTPGDIPILGTVAAYWNDDVKPSDIPSRWWDGNGIPNSTTKYREDRKVSWHVMPFEERLEKALSEEKSISQRRHINKAHVAIQDSEIDTAGSQLQTYSCPSLNQLFHFDS